MRSEEVAAEATWRLDPALMAHELSQRTDRPFVADYEIDVEVDGVDAVEADQEAFDDAHRFMLYPHTKLLGRKFADAALGVSKRQIWVLPPRYGKPVHVDTPVLCADGARRRLGDIRVGDRVISHTGRARRVLAVHEQGDLPLVKVVTHSGRTVLAAGDHPFLTTQGWVDAGDLRPGHVLALRLRPVLETVGGDSDVEHRMAGYFVGDGHCGYSGVGVKNLGALITNADPGIIEDVERCAAKLGWRSAVHHKPPRAPAVNLSGGVREWLRGVGLAGHTSYTKRVPAFVFTSPVDQVAAFLGAYFACDGNISWRRASVNGVRKGGAAEFYSVNRDLLADVQHLLLRIGVRSRLTLKNGRYKDQIHESWRLTISSDSDLARLMGVIRPAGEKGGELPVTVTEFDRPYLEDPVVSAGPTGTVGPCRCLTVETDSTWLANDFVVHNTSVGSHWGPVWYLELWPHKSVILGSYNDRLARRNGRTARNLMKAHAKRLRVQLSVDTKAADEWNTVEGGGLLAAGVGSTMTGFGADVLIIDDPVKNMKDVSSPTFRDDLWDWYQSTARTRIHKGGAIIVIATRWHIDDLTGRLLAQDRRRVERGAPPVWEVIHLPAIADSELVGGPDLLGREDGDVLCPGLYPASEVLELRDDVDDQTWRSLYQGSPVSVEGEIWQRSWFQTYWAPPEPHTVWRWSMSWDMSFKDAATSSFVVGQVWANIGADHYLMEQVRGRWDYPRTRSEVVRLYQRWPRTTRIMVESKANGPAIISDLGRIIPGFDPIEPVGTKYARAQAVSPTIKSGHVWIPDPGVVGWVNEFLAEVTSYPGAQNDDQVDATSQYLAHTSGILEPIRTSYGHAPLAR